MRQMRKTANGCWYFDNLFLSNCSLALIERILGFHLFEYSDSMKLGASFRSFAFGGHPLANAVVISTIMNFCG